LNRVTVTSYNRGNRRRSLGGKLAPNVDFSGGDTVCETGVSLDPGRWAQWVLEVDEYTSKVTVDIDPADNPVPVGPSAAYGFPESFELYLHSAKRGGVASDLVDSANVWDDARVEISGGSKALSGGICCDLIGGVPPIIEPGLMKVVLQSDWTNNTPGLTADVCITREQGGDGGIGGGAAVTLGTGDGAFFAVDIPAGAASATFTAQWTHDWTKVPTGDLDMLFVSPSSFPFFDFSYLDGATLNSPEQQTIANPEAGTWYFLVDGYDLHKGGKDPVKVSVTVD
jgi:hypothetical protein